MASGTGVFAQNQGADDAKDSDSNPTTGAMPAEVLVSGENNLTYDAGIYIPAKLGDYVGEDHKNPFIRRRNRKKPQKRCNRQKWQKAKSRRKMGEKGGLTR
jgi:hypothetical protein